MHPIVLFVRDLALLLAVMMTHAAVVLRASYLMPDGAADSWYSHDCGIDLATATDVFHPACLALYASVDLVALVCIVSLVEFVRTKWANLWKQKQA